MIENVYEVSVALFRPTGDALAESATGLCKTELVKPVEPWRTGEQLEITTRKYVDWFNHRRLFETCGDISLVEVEQAHYRQQAAPQGRPIKPAGLRTPHLR